MDRLVALIMCKDYLSLLENTLQNLLENNIKNFVICNCYTGKEARELKMIVRNFFSIHEELKYHLFYHKFKNYFEARNALFDYSDNIYGKDKVYLISDPGDNLKILDKEEFESCINNISKKVCYFQSGYLGPILGYHIKQKNKSDISWYLLKLISSHRKDIRYSGYAHEYIDYNSGGTLKTDCIVQYYQSEYTEFIKRCNTVRSLLEEELLEQEKNKDKYKYARTLFYLAQEYHCINEWERAFDLLNKRVEIDGYIEEKFEAYRRLLITSIDLKKPKEVIDKYFEKACNLQKRAEIYILYIRYLISIKSKEEDLIYIHKLCEECLAIEYPKSILFVNEKSYTTERTELYLSLFPTKFEKPKECEVCYMNNVELLKCKHWCCRECINKLTDKKCPFCRQSIV